MSASSGITVTLDERSLARAQARLAKYEGRPLRDRMRAVFRAGAGLAVAPMRAAAPKRTGTLARRVSVRSRRPPAGYIVQFGTKSRAPHGHLVSKGHRIVTPGGRDTGRRTRPDPFVEDTIRAHEDRIVGFISRNVASEGVTVLGGSIGGF